MELDHEITLIPDSVAGEIKDCHPINDSRDHERSNYENLSQIDNPPQGTYTPIEEGEDNIGILCFVL
jgi:hypothetical protein